MTIRRPRRSSFSEPVTKQLAWDIDLRPVTVEGNTLPDYQSIVRSDNGHVLSLTKKTYHPASNEKFAEVIGRIHEFTGFDVEGYSVFHGGRKVLAFLKNKEKMRVGDFDSNNYMVIGNSFDRSTGFFTGISSVVIRCTNQFSRIQTTQTIRHNKQINMKLDELVCFYKDYMRQEQQLKEVFEIWNQNPIDKHTVEGFADHVLEIPNENVSTVKKNNRLSLFDSINNEMAAMGNTAYGLFNGLTHYTSHVVKSSSKMFGNALGHSYRLNERGFQFFMPKNLHNSYNLPEPPFHVYFLRDSEVFPKRLYTVTGVGRQRDRITLFIFELRNFIDFDDRYIRVVEGFSVN